MIKYHDNQNGPQYGEDHHLTNNWNPEPIYNDNEYIKVYFRVEAQGYNCAGAYWEQEEQREAFFAEMRGILSRFGVPEGTGHRTENLPGMEHLYIHPQSVSGVMAKNRIKDIAEALDACETAAIRWVDLYEEISTMTDEEFRATLVDRTEEIEKDLLEAFKTKRRNLYIVPSFWSGPVSRLSDKYTIRRRSCESGEDGICYSFIYSLFERMVKAGKIVAAETKHGTGYRTAKKDEQRITA